jgi:hypothetical protein
MFECIFERRQYANGLGSVGQTTSGTVAFRNPQQLTYVGERIYAEFTWTNAHRHAIAYAFMYITDPLGNTKAEMFALPGLPWGNADGSFTLHADTDMAGMWQAYLFIYDENDDKLTYIATKHIKEQTTPPPGEGQAQIVNVQKPSSFTPGKEFSVFVDIKNIGSSPDQLFARLKNVDTGQTLGDNTSLTIQPGAIDSTAGVFFVTLNQTNDFNGKIEAGHIV